jgi:nicotinamide mononucleotide transporter
MSRPSAATGIEVLVISAVTVLLLAASWFKWLPLDFTEALGFATGAVCVWLVTKGNIWNWPVGLANNLFFAVLFWKARLFADFGLQGVYLILGIYGWYEWLRGGENQTRLAISRSSRSEWIGIALFLIVGTWGLRELLHAVNGAAPLWDALTTALSLVAQYLLCRKRIENWFFWIAADVIYVPLYLSKQLPLTALLYGGFLVLCVIGWRRWRKELYA